MGVSVREGPKCGIGAPKQLKNLRSAPSVASPRAPVWRKSGACAKNDVSQALNRPYRSNPKIAESGTMDCRAVLGGMLAAVRLNYLAERSNVP